MKRKVALIQFDARPEQVERNLGGCALFAADGSVLAAANRNGREEILLHDLDLQPGHFISP